MKAQKNPSKYDAYRAGQPASLTTVKGALAFVKLADIFAPGHGPVVAVAPADLPAAAIEDMISEGVDQSSTGYQFQISTATGQPMNIGLSYEEFRAGTNDVLAIRQIFSIGEEQVYVKLLAADSEAKAALIAYMKGIVDAAIQFDGGR